MENNKEDNIYVCDYNKSYIKYENDKLILFDKNNKKVGETECLSINYFNDPFVSFNIISTYGLYSSYDNIIPNIILLNDDFHLIKYYHKELKKLVFGLFLNFKGDDTHIVIDADDIAYSNDNDIVYFTKQYNYLDSNYTNKTKKKKRTFIKEGTYTFKINLKTLLKTNDITDLYYENNIHIIDSNYYDLPLYDDFIPNINDNVLDISSNGTLILKNGTLLTEEDIDSIIKEDNIADNFGNKVIETSTSFQLVDFDGKIIGECLKYKNTKLEDFGNFPIEQINDLFYIKKEFNINEKKYIIKIGLLYNHHDFISVNANDYNTINKEQITLLRYIEEDNKIIFGDVDVDNCIFTKINFNKDIVKSFNNIYDNNNTNILCSVAFETNKKNYIQNNVNITEQSRLNKEDLEKICNFYNTDLFNKDSNNKNIKKESKKIINKEKKQRLPKVTLDGYTLMRDVKDIKKEKHYVYILYFKYLNIYKIGKTKTLKSRINTLTLDYGDIDINKTMILEINKGGVSILEKELHHIFSDKNLVNINGIRTNGDTELFSKEINNNNLLLKTIGKVIRLYNKTTNKINLITDNKTIIKMIY